MTLPSQTDADRIAELESRLAALTALVERLAGSAPAATVLPIQHDVESATSSRRGMLKLAGAAAAGAAAVAVAGNCHSGRGDRRVGPDTRAGR